MHPRHTSASALFLLLLPILSPLLLFGPPPSATLYTGYQGWYATPGDLRGLEIGWFHWTTRSVPPGPKTLTVDVWPDLSSLLDSPAVTIHPWTNGRQEPLHFFSSIHPDVVNRHAEWMENHGIDVVVLQRFVAMLEHPVHRQRIDLLLNLWNERCAHGSLKLLVMYDPSGCEPSRACSLIRRDWSLLASKLYGPGGGGRQEMSRQGLLQPALILWGLGLKDRPLHPADARALIHDLQTGDQALPPTTVWGGVPTFWRTLRGDSRADYASVYEAFDLLFPWSVGRFWNERTLTLWLDEIEQDLALCASRNQGYLPCLFPGFSWRNLVVNRGGARLAPHASPSSRSLPGPARSWPGEEPPPYGQLNQIPRQCGLFLWNQAVGCFRRGCQGAFIAMFDELDEGTAIMPLVESQDQLPSNLPLVALDQDGYSLPSDHYLWLAHKIKRLWVGELPQDQEEMVFLTLSGTRVRQKALLIGRDLVSLSWRVEDPLRLGGQQLELWEQADQNPWALVDTSLSIPTGRHTLAFPCDNTRRTFRLVLRQGGREQASSLPLPLPPPTAPKSR